MAHVVQVKYPNLYASKADNKHADEFNRVQRGDQNINENLPYTLAYAAAVALATNEPHTAGLALIISAFFRWVYAYGYSGSVGGRTGGFMMALFVENLLIGRLMFFGLGQFGIYKL